MFFWFANSAVALLFCGLICFGTRQRSWIFVAINFFGMVVAGLVVLLDILSYLFTTMLVISMPVLALVFVADAVTLFRDLRSDRAAAAPALPTATNGKYLFKSEERQDYLIIADEKRLERELCRDPRFSSKDREAALQLWKKGNEAFLQSGYQEAAARYKLSVKVVPTPSTLSNLAGVLIQTFHAEAALQDCRAACALDPEHHEAWINRGVALLLLKRHEEALSCFDQATTLQPNALEPWICRGNALRKLGQFCRAIECYDTALRINLARPECWYEKALALTKLEDLSGALRCFEHVLEIDPTYWHAWLKRGVVMDKLGRLDQAMTSYRRFLELAPPQMKKHINSVCSRLQQLENKHGEHKMTDAGEQSKAAVCYGNPQG